MNIDNFIKRGEEHLEKQHQQALSTLKKEYEKLKKAIDEHEATMAMSEWKSAESIPTRTVAPEYLNFGSLKILDSKGNPMDEASVPLLLNTKVNAVMLSLGDDAEKVPNLFQNLMLRLMLSMRMDLIKISIVDMHYGRSFPVLRTLKNKMCKIQQFHKQTDVTTLLTDLGKEVGASNKFLGTYPDIDAYNAAAGDMAQPYHFVFIDDFPNGFTPQTIDDLLQLIDNGNALSAGIRIFINYNKHATPPREFNLQRFKDCVWLSKGENGNISFGNWFRCPQHTIPSIDLEVTGKVAEYVEFINGLKQREVVYTLDPWIEELKEKNLVWSGDTSDGIKVPIGFITPNQTFDFYLANDNDRSCQDYFVLVAGKPGSGKSTLLNTLIVNMAMKYSPDELCLYLVDFANGNSFRSYRALPHVKSLMISDSKEYTLRMLNDLIEESKRRAEQYGKLEKEKNVQIDKLSVYRKYADDKYPCLPRIVLIMDELHAALNDTDKSHSAEGIRERLDYGIKEFRKYGISMILCTQTFLGINIGSAKALATYRLALALPEVDSDEIIRNKAAVSLNSAENETIMNNTLAGLKENNVLFKGAWSPNYINNVNYLAQLYKERYGKTNKPYICESGTNANIAENEGLLDKLTNGSFTQNHQYCDVYVGKPDLLRDQHTRIRYHRQQNSNTLILGKDYKTMLYDMAIQLIQLQGCSHPNSKICIVDGFNFGDQYQGALDGMSELSNSYSVGTYQNITQYIDEFCAELERRKVAQKEGKMIEERWILAITNTQNCYDLKPSPNRYESPNSKKLATLLAEGGPLGMHCIIHALSYETLFKTNGIFDTKQLALFENRIFLKGADVDNLIGIKFNAPENNGLMIVQNAKVDGEVYEQCKAYSDITVNGDMNSLVEYISNLFDKFRYA